LKKIIIKRNAEWNRIKKSALREDSQYSTENEDEGEEEEDSWSAIVVAA
jgi:hypothetical protein